jgi:methionyl-tRNA synthetase
MQSQKPWELIKQGDKARAATVTHYLLQLVAHLSLIFDVYLHLLAFTNTNNNNNNNNTHNNNNNNNNNNDNVAIYSVVLRWSSLATKLRRVEPRRQLPHAAAYRSQGTDWLVH